MQRSILPTESTTAQAIRTPAPKPTRNLQIAWYTGIFDKLFMAFVYLFVLVFAWICLLPFLLIVSASFTPEANLRLEGFGLIPSNVSIYSYEFVLSGQQVYRAYANTLFVTIAGTVLGMVITTPFAYVMASRKAKYAGFLAFITYFTMIFGGGLVGFYILVTRWLGLKDNMLAIILPYLLNPFFAFILVAYFRTLPAELNDAATLDGANDAMIFWKIAVPLGKPAIASVTLFYALRYWNDWWLSLLFIDNENLHTLQMMIRKVYATVNAAQYVGASNLVIREEVPTYGVQMSTAVLTIGPIIFFYPFIQRYFIKGMTIGAIKG
jgi:putative aldouronate transport system permease protein